MTKITVLVLAFLVLVSGVNFVYRRYVERMAHRNIKVTSNFDFNKVALAEYAIGLVVLAVSMGLLVWGINL